MSDRLAYTVPEAAQKLGINPRTLRQMERDGEISFARMRSKCVVPVSELERILKPKKNPLPLAKRKKLRLIPRV